MLARRRALGVVAAAVVVVGGLIYALVREGDNAKKTSDAEPLAYVPTQAREAVFDLDTRAPLVSVALEQLAARLVGLPAAQVRPLLGGQAVVAMGGGKTWMIFATNADPPPGAVAQDGAVVVARTRADVDAALAAAKLPAADDARTTFDRRFEGLGRGSARVAFDPRIQLAKRLPELADTRWGRSLRDGAAVLRTEGNQLNVPFKVTADPVGLNPLDLPVGAGATAPQPRGRAPLVIGLREPARTLQFARDVGLFDELDVVDQLPGFLRPNLSDLGPDGTLTLTDIDDREHLTVRTEPPDPGDWARKLARLDALSDVAGSVGLTDAEITQRDGVYELSDGDRRLARVGVFGRALVLSNDPRANLRDAAQAPPAPVPDAQGGLTARLAASALLPELPALLSTRIGDVTGWARAELAGLRGELRLEMR